MSDGKAAPFEEVFLQDRFFVICEGVIDGFVVVEEYNFGDGFDLPPDAAVATGVS